jgi:hypothetical protein
MSVMAGVTPKKRAPRKVMIGLPFGAVANE